MVYRSIVAAAACLVLLGCVSSKAIQVGDLRYSARPETAVVDVYIPVDAPVEVHKSIPTAKLASALPADAREIGRIDTEGSRTSWESVIEDAKVEARKLGGDAIVIKNWDNFLAGVSRGGKARHDKNLSVTVVRYGAYTSVTQH